MVKPQTAKSQSDEHMHEVQVVMAGLRSQLIDGHGAGGSPHKRSQAEQKKKSAIPMPSILMEEIERLRQTSKPAPARFAEAPEPAKPPPQPHRPRIPTERVHTTVTSLSPHNAAKTAGGSSKHQQGHGSRPAAEEGGHAAGAAHTLPTAHSAGNRPRANAGRDETRPAFETKSDAKLSSPLAPAGHHSKDPSSSGPKRVDAGGEPAPAGAPPAAGGVAEGEEGGAGGSRKVTVVQLSTSARDATSDAPTNSISHTYSTIGRMLSCTGINGRADGQFSILAGVAIGPDGLLFVSDRDTQTHVDVLRIEQDETSAAHVPLAKVLTAETRIVVPTATALRPDTTTTHSSTMRRTSHSEHMSLQNGAHAPESVALPSKLSTEKSQSRTISPNARGRSPVVGSTSSPSGRGRGGHSPAGRTLSPSGRGRGHSPAGRTSSPSGRGHFGPRHQGQSGTMTSFLRHGHTVPLRASGITFIADSDNHCLQVLRADGTHLRRIGSFGAAGGQFNALQGLAVHCMPGSDTYLLYVADTCNHRVQVFSFHKSDGADVKLERIIGKEGKDNGHFRYPVGICVVLPLGKDESTGRLIVADTGNDRIQIFTTGGEHLMSVGAAGRQPVTEEGMPCFRGPFDVAVCGGLLFVTDEGNHRVQVLNTEGQYVRSIGSQGPKMGCFIRPRCVYATSSGAVLVSDQENQRVQMLYPDVELGGEQIYRWMRLK